MNLNGILTSLPPYMMLGFFLGLLFGDPTGESANISMLALGFMMTFSMSEMVFEFGRGEGKFREFAAPALLTFGLLTPVLIFVGLLYGGDLGLGWWLAASMPAAIAIVPYSERMKGDMKIALHGEIGIYLLALLVTPTLAALLLGASVDVFELLKTLLLLILIPMGLSRLVRRMGLSATMRGMATNISFMIFFMVVVGANRSIFFGETISVLILAIASFAAVFGVGEIVDFALRRRAVGERRVLTMFSALKNTGLAIAVSLSLGIDEMALPATMLVIFEMLWAVYLFSWKYKDEGPTENPA
jgi:BASS family bile acid:Na+ symporter